MSIDAFRNDLEAAGLSQNGLAALLGVDGRVVRRWCSGANPIPPKVAAWVHDLANWHREHPVPTEW